MCGFQRRQYELAVAFNNTASSLFLRFQNDQAGGGGGSSIEDSSIILLQQALEAVAVGLATTTDLNDAAAATNSSSCCQTTTPPPPTRENVSASGRPVTSTRSSCSLQEQETNLSIYLAWQELEAQTTPSLLQQTAHLQPLALASSPSAYSQQDEDYSSPLMSFAVATAIIFFNLAVVYHRQYQRQQDTGLLERAASFYVRSLQALCNLGLSPLQASGNALLDLTFMAIYVNLSHLDYGGCYAGDNGCLERFVTFAHSVRLTAYDDWSHQYLQWFTSSHLHSTRILLEQQESSTLSAAAA